MEVYGDWIKFVDGEGATVKIDPSVIRELHEFATANKAETAASISNLQIKAYLERLMGRVARRYQGSQEDRDVAYGMEIVYFDLINLLNGEEV
jgi:hypothetical protein